MVRNLILDWRAILAEGFGLGTQATETHALALLPQTILFLRFCEKTRRRLFLLDNGAAPPLAEQLAQLHITHFFEKVYTGAVDIDARIGEILAAHDLVPPETAFLGSTLHALASARDAGVMAIAVLADPDSPEKCGRANPDVIVRDLGELQKLLENLPAPDEIVINELELLGRVGVTEAERAAPQRLTVSLRLEPLHDFRDLGDDLYRTVDYAAVCAELQRFVETRADRLIETLAEAMAEQLLARFAIRRVELELRKFILRQTSYVGVRVTRSSSG